MKKGKPKLVIDTNIFFSGLNPESYYYPILRGIYSGKYKLLVSTPVLLEYEEILQRFFAKKLLDHFWLFILTSESVVFVSPTFNFQLPFSDGDDQKFVDCAVCGNADYLITNDKHYNIMKDIKFPKVRIIRAETFIEKFIP